MKSPPWTIDSPRGVKRVNLFYLKIMLTQTVPFSFFSENAQLPVERIQPPESVIFQEQHLTRVTNMQPAVVPALRPSPLLDTRLSVRLMMITSDDDDPR